MAIDYQQLMEQSVLALADLVRKRREVDAEIVRLQKFVRAMAAKRSVGGFPEADPAHISPPLGITEAVSRVLEASRMCLTPVLIRDLLPCVGFDTSRYKEPLPSIHVVLKRLVNSRQVMRVPLQNGDGYLWTGLLLKPGMEREQPAIRQPELNSI
ncbi:MAG TPA: hypothetical protein VJQ82_19805 [Terriglobales bacterium]|nr:hypothetical protein [Terriglobales bacterium]